MFNHKLMLVLYFRDSSLFKVQVPSIQKNWRIYLIIKYNILQIKINFLGHYNIYESYKVFAKIFVFLFSFLMIFGLFYIHYNESSYQATFIGLFVGVFISFILGYFGVINKRGFWVIFNVVISFGCLAFYAWEFYEWYYDKDMHLEDL